MFTHSSWFFCVVMRVPHLQILKCGFVRILYRKTCDVLFSHARRKLSITHFLVSKKHWLYGNMYTCRIVFVVHPATADAYTNNTAVTNIANITAPFKTCWEGFPTPFDESMSSSPPPVVLVDVDVALLLSAPLSAELGCCMTTGSSVVVFDAGMLLLLLCAGPSGSTTAGSSLVLAVVAIALVSSLG